MTPGVIPMASPATEVGPAGAQSKRGKKPAKGRITPPVSRRGASPDLKSPRHKVMSKAEAAAARKKETRKKEEETAAVAASSAAAMRVRMAAEQEKKETARLLEIAATHSNRHIVAGCARALPLPAESLRWHRHHTGLPGNSVHTLPVAPLGQSSASWKVVSSM